HLPRPPPGVPARPHALPRLSSVHPHAAPHARLPRGRGAGAQPAPTLRPVQVRDHEPRLRGLRRPARRPLDEVPPPALPDRRGPRRERPPFMKILLVGLGRWGEKHLRVLRELGVTVWVADVADARRQWAIARGVEPGHAVEDYRAALDRV